MTTKRLNIKFLAILGVGGLIFLVAVYGLHEFQVRRNAVGLLRRAEVARTDGDLSESARLRMRYLSHRPEDSIQYKETALDLKKSLFDKVQGRKEWTKRDVDLSVRYMEDAVVHNGEDLEIRREAADFWFKLRKYDTAIDNLNQLKDKEGGWTETDRMMYINSLRLLGGPNEQEALEELEKALGWNSAKSSFDEGKAEHPEMLDAYQALVMILMQKNLDRDSATKVMNRMVLANMDNFKAFLNHSRLVRFISGRGGVEQAHKDIREAYRLAPDEIEVITAMSGMLLETERAEDAKQLIETGLAKAETVNNKSRLFKLLAEVFVTTKDNDGALAVLERGNREVPKDPDLLWTKARLLLEQKRYKDVEEMYKPLKKAGQDESMIGYLKARILMDNGETLKATKGLRKIRNILPAKMQYEADIYLSEGYGKLGKLDLQLDMIRELRKSYPDNQSVNESYLNVLMRLRRTKDAQEFINARIAELKAADLPIPQSYNLALMTLQMNDATTGASQLTDAQQTALDEQIERTLSDESIPEQQRQTLLLTKLQQNNDPKAAKATLKNAISKSPESRKQFMLWAMLLDYAENAAEANDFFSRMKKSVDIEKHRVQLLSMEAKIAVKHAPESASGVLTSLEGQLNGLTDKEQAALLFDFGKLHFAIKDPTTANRLFEKALEKDPKQITILNTLFENAMAKEDPDQIDTIAKRIREAVGPDDDSYRIVEARRIVWRIRHGQTGDDQRKSQLAKAQELIQSIRSERKEWLPGILVESDIQRLGGNPMAAVELLEVAHSYQTTNARIIRAIAQSYRELKQPARAAEWMRKLPSNLRNESDDQIALKTLWSRRNSWTASDAEKAVQLVEKLAPKEAKTVENQLLRSQIYLHLKRMPLAEAAAQRAVEIQPQMADVWTNLVNIYGIQNQKDKALEVIQEADSRLPEALKPIVIGRCYAILRDFNQAQVNFLSALKSDPKNASVKRMLAETFVKDQKVGPAIKVIQDIIKTADPQKDVMTLIWARRALAKVFSSTKNHQAYQKALDLLEENAVDGELSRDDLSLFVAFSYARPEKASWDRALIRIEQIAKKRKLTDDEIFMKAQLYEKYGDEHWKEVKKMTTSVLSRNKSNTPAIENYVRWLLKRGEVEEAETWAQNNLSKTAVTRFRVDVHSDAKRKRFRKAVEKIQQRLPQNLNGPGEKSQQLTLAAVAEELGQYDPRFYKMAEKMLKDLAAKEPSETLRVATVMGKYGDAPEVKEALNMCFTAHKSGISNDFSARVALAILREHPQDWDGTLASSIQSVGSWLDQVSSTNREDLILQWRVAEFYDMIGDLDRVEEMYQILLDSPEFKNPTDRGMVMNNLAFAMALNGKASEPMQLINDAEKALGPTSDTIDTKGFIYFVQGDTDMAISEFQRAISNGPKSAQKYFHLALALHKKNDRSKAAGSWKTALQNGLDKFKLPPALRPQFDMLESQYGGMPVDQL